MYQFYKWKVKQNQEGLFIFKRGVFPKNWMHMGRVTPVTLIREKIPTVWVNRIKNSDIFCVYSYTAHWTGTRYWECTEYH